ncbi:hypothetical protein [Sedimentisphaera salicampi]|uniref:hypothetical protein n=1 Tax=Sedimentisphaera salicampi TaxID=1941349 RepID=UPI001054BADB|nr:hypothetical protein [Sedimentisphaera salicampi]
MLKTVAAVFDSTSCVIAPDAENTAMNNPEMKIVEYEISRKSLLSSSIENIVKEGLISSIIRHIRRIIENTGCLSVSTKVFLAIVISFINIYKS